MQLKKKILIKNKLHAEKINYLQEKKIRMKKIKCSKKKLHAAKNSSLYYNIK